LRAIAFVFAAGFFRLTFFAIRLLGVSFFLLATVVFDFVCFLALDLAGIGWAHLIGTLRLFVAGCS